MRHLTLLLVGLAGLFAAGAATAAAPFRDCPHCPEMVSVPGGAFTLGTPEDEPGRDKSEGPPVQVTIKAFAIGRFDVTRGEWAAFVADTHRPIEGGCSWASDSGPTPDPARSWANVAFVQDDRHPVVCVTWKDARDYVAWLSQKTGKPYRLPSEAEWDYAARAGTTTAFPWGATASHDNANYGADACCSGLAAGQDQWAATSPVGSFPPNGFGLYDMNGNVLQWVEDCLSGYADKPRDGAPFETSRPLGADNPVSPKMAALDSCAFRMLRGGDWGDPPDMIRSGFRNYAPPKGSTLDTYRSAGAGFRVALTLP